jgi:hypothetical protein
MLDEKTGIDFPMLQSQAASVFGDPRTQEAKAYLKTMDFSEFQSNFSHVLDYEGNPWNFKIYGNYIIEDPLRRAFGNLAQRGLAQEFRTFDGCFNIRQSKGGGTFSQHSWGIAVDFNASTNRYGQEPTLSPDFVKCFSECGFEWGGLWSTPDGMHFQLFWVRIRNDGNPLNPVPWQA